VNPAMSSRPAASEILALTLCAEADDQPVRALEALAAMVANRARLAAADATLRLRFAPGAAQTGLLEACCRAPFLFECWTPRHPRRAALLRALRQPDARLEVCRRIARRAVAGGLVDPTIGATHCHRADTLPGWALGHAPSAEIGGFVFYRLPPAEACSSGPAGRAGKDWPWIA
jgi:N-acetylmuramoyl-L-alanine amidase